MDSTFIILIFAFVAIIIAITTHLTFQAKGHGISPMGEEEPTYMSCTIWKDRDAFNGWKNGAAFKQAHAAPSSSGSEEKKEDDKPAQPPAPLWSKPPVPVFYEGSLVISSADGA